MISFEYTFTERYLRDALKHRGSIQRTRLLLTGVKGICLLCLLAITTLLVSKKEYTGSLILFAFALLLVFSRTIDLFIAGRRIRRSPYWNRKVRIEFGDDGVSMASDLGTSNIKWEAFTRAVSLNSGYLLYQGPDAFFWLPMSAMSDQASRAGFSNMLRERTKKYEEKA